MHFLYKFFVFVSAIFSGGAFTHSLSWHRKGEHIPGCKLYARVWTPEDPLSNNQNKSYVAAGLSTYLQ